MNIHHDDIIYPNAVGFTLVHIACIGAIWSGVTLEAVLLGLALYVVRMFGVTAGFHRYFSHRTFKTSRVGQFLLGFLAQTSAQSGLLWWAAQHRRHHAHSDTPEDPHSPRQHGLWFAHFGWIFHERTEKADYSKVPDLTRYPELVWLDKNRFAPAMLLAVFCFLVAGAPGLFVGFFWSTVATYHGTFAINSLAHTAGTQRYVTGDDSRNNWWLALVTLGEGWHNNHHHYQASTRQGFRWWEVDVTYYVLEALSWTGLVWGLKAPPEEVVRGEHRLPRPVVDKAALQIVAEVSAEAVAYLQDSSRRISEEAHRILESAPSLEELREIARRKLADTPSREQIVARARELLEEVAEAHRLSGGQLATE